MQKLNISTYNDDDVVVFCVFDGNAICRLLVFSLVFFSLNRNRLFQVELADSINCRDEVLDSTLQAEGSH